MTFSDFGWHIAHQVRHHGTPPLLLQAMTCYVIPNKLSKPTTSAVVHPNQHIAFKGLLSFTTIQFHRPPRSTANNPTAGISKIQSAQ